jgi:hypothetical protein
MITEMKLSLIAITDKLCMFKQPTAFRRVCNCSEVLLNRFIRRSVRTHAMRQKFVDICHFVSDRPTITDISHEHLHAFPSRGSDWMGNPTEER